jgi:hypothetical protein
MRGSTALAVAAVVLAAAGPAVAGPPYLTDDPVPTDRGHWEIYAFAEGEGHGSAIDGDAGLDLNYGATDGVQLTATLPVSLAHEPSRGWSGGTGNVEIGVKYRLLEDREAGFSAAVFPRVILPTASRTPGGRAQFLLPLWLGKEFPGGTSLFGGGGYLVNAGGQGRDSWQAGVALTQELGKSVSVGTEITGEGSDEIGGTVPIRPGFGSVVTLSEHSSILFSAGPTFADHRTSYHVYAALGLNY